MAMHVMHGNSEGREHVGIIIIIIIIIVVVVVVVVIIIIIETKLKTLDQTNRM
jgi:flagellar basal body-associated protein FliL